MNIMQIENLVMHRHIDLAVFSKLMKKLAAHKGDDAQLDARNSLIYLDDCNAMSFDGQAEIYQLGGKSRMILLAPNSIASIVLKDGNERHFFNDLAREELAVSGVKPQPHKDTPALAWLIAGDVSPASKAMCRQIFGMPGLSKAICNKLGLAENEPHPTDAEDMLRCVKFVEATGCQDRIDVMRDVSPEWDRIIDHWKDLSWDATVVADHAITTLLLRRVLDAGESPSMS